MADITGTPGSDTLIGTSDKDELRGLAGDDFLDGGGGSDLVNGGTGNDTVAFGLGYGKVTYVGQAGADTVRVNGSLMDVAFVQDTVLSFGSFGSDTFRTVGLVDGSTLQERQATGGGLVQLQAAGMLVVQFVATTGVASVQAGGANDILAGTDAAQLLDGGVGNDILYGNQGADTLRGGDGDDYLSTGLDDGQKDIFDGGAGFNTVSYSGAGGGITLDLATYSASGSAIGNDEIYNVQNAVGSLGNDTLIGHDGATNSLWGFWGNDYVYGLGGDDALSGGHGNDVLLGAAGNDALSGDAGQDYLYGGAGTNVLAGGDGVDVVISEGVNDSLLGGEGDDSLYAYGTGISNASGGGGNDIFVMQSGTGTADGGEGQDYLYMGTANDTLLGGGGVDVLIGGGGTNYYDGGAGVDYLYLGSGNDTIHMYATSSVDVVNEFQAGGTNDAIVFHGSRFTAISQVLEATTDYGSYSVIQVDADTAVWLIGVAKSQLTTNDFAIV